MSAHRYSFRVVGTPTPAHTTLRLFVNGASAGLLTLTNDEAADFRERLNTGCERCGGVRTSFVDLCNACAEEDLGERWDSPVPDDAPETPAGR